MQEIPGPIDKSQFRAQEQGDKSPEWATKRDKLYTHIESNSRYVINFYELVASFKNKDSRTKIRTALGDYCQGLRSIYPEAAEKADEIPRISKQIDLLESKIDEIEAPEVDDEAEQEKYSATLQPLQEELSKLIWYRHELENDDDVRLISNTEEVVESLLAKNKITSSSSRDQLLNSFLSRLGNPTIDVNRVGIVKEPFCVIFLFEPEDFELVGNIYSATSPTTIGINIPLTPFIAVKREHNRPYPQTHFTSGHEKTHNLLEATDIHLHNTAAIQLEKEVKRLRELLSPEEGTPLWLLAADKRKFMKYTSAQKLLDSLHEEVISSLEKVESYGASSMAEDAERARSLSRFFGVNLRHEKTTGIGLGTAFVNFRKILRSLNIIVDLAQSKGDDELEQFTIRVAEEFKSSFESMVSELEESTDILNEFDVYGTERHIVLMSLASLFQPTNYGRITKFLKWELAQASTGRVQPWPWKIRGRYVRR